ncbi:MAG: pyridoxamine 5'-phosphate oxidase [Dehalococcoidia bacterium]
MATWSDFANAEPEMARRGRELLNIPVAYLATVRRDGAPRLHPLSPMFAEGRLFVAIQSSAPRRYDLLRDGRYSLHGLPPMLGPDYDEFEINVTGRATLVRDATLRALVNEAEHARNRPSIEDDAWLFELDIETALTTVWNHKMVERGGRWIPTLDEMPQATHRVWNAA